jgi:hypothetical protein
MAWGRTNKYKAMGVRDELGNFYPSKGEAARARALQLEQKAGLIRDLKFHPSVEIFPGLNWKLDSCYTQTDDGVTYWEDFKGVMTRETMIKIKIWEYLGPGPLRIVKGDYRTNRFRVDKEYKPYGLQRLIKDHTCAA